MPWNEDVKPWPKDQKPSLACYVIPHEWVALEGGIKKDLQDSESWPQLIACVYNTLKNQNIKYDLEERSDDVSSQIIRPPDQ
jgi:hypothetical protein